MYKVVSKMKEENKKVNKDNEEYNSYRDKMREFAKFIEENDVKKKGDVQDEE